MKKNNKGFTLIEIIAVVTILGILSVIVVPRIFSLISDSREQIYLQDARRLIAQAQYKMSSNSTLIEKPSEGECILMSLNYLNSSDFQSPPHGGNYLTDASFVAIKNDSGVYKYAAMLVEKTKEGAYRGVKLSTEEELNSKKALRNVDSFTLDQVYYIDTESAATNGGREINYDFINSNLKEYGTNQQWLSEGGNPIIGRYNFEKEVDNSSEYTSVPKFTAKVLSADSKNNEALQVNLIVSASDADTSTADLKVCSKVSRKADDSYPDFDSSYCSPYGGGDSYSKNIDLTAASNGGFTFKEQTTAYIYVIVYDTERNVSKKKVEYYTHKNQAPEIKKFSIKTTNSNNINVPSVNVSLDVIDDLDELKDLKVCVKQDYNYDACSDYVPYSSVFGSKGVYSYVFKNSSGEKITTPDGSKHTLKVFVKDSLDEVSSSEAEYTIYKNQAPVISVAEMQPSVKYKDKNGYSVNLKLVIKDDLSNDNNIKLKIVSDKDVEKEVSAISLSSFKNNQVSGLYAYNFPEPDYDGKSRTLEIIVTDEYGETSRRKLVLDNVYSNSAPDITIKSITGSSVCDNCNINRGGGYDVSVSLSIVDDLVKQDDFESEGFKICVNEDLEKCARDNENFKVYSTNELNYSFTKPKNENEYYLASNTTKKLYVAVIDNYGAYKVVSGDYNVYKNQAPTITGNLKVNTTSNYTLEGKEVSYNVPKAFLDTSGLKIVDDFNNVMGEVCYSVYNKNGGLTFSEKCDRVDDKISFSEFLSKINGEYIFKEGNQEITRLEGQAIRVRLKVTDDYGQFAYSNAVDYKLHEDVAPVIKSIKLDGLVKDSDDDPGYNGNVVSAVFSVLDFYDTYSICFTEKEECSNSDYVDLGGKLSGTPVGKEYQSYSYNYNGVDHGWSNDYTDENPNKTFTFSVKDSRGNVVKYDKDLKYTVYVSCSDENNLIGGVKTIVDENGNEVNVPDYKYVPLDNDKTKVISAETCGAKCYHKYLNNFKEGLTPEEVFNNYSIKYNKMLSFTDKYTYTSCNSKVISVEDKYCDYADCFFPSDKNSISSQTIYIGLKKYDTVDSPNVEYVDMSISTGEGDGSTPTDNNDNSTVEGGENNDDGDSNDAGGKIRVDINTNSWTYFSKDVTEKVRVDNPVCSSIYDDNMLMFCSDDVRCKDNKYCTNQGLSNCKREAGIKNNADGHCSYHKVYNPKPCKSGETPESDGCYRKALRACDNGEDPSIDECLRTCSANEIPEEGMCTPYSAYEVGEDYLSYNAFNPRPCKEGENPMTDSCYNEALRPCRDGEDSTNYKCLRQCGYLKDDDGNFILDENGEKIKEDPEAALCTPLKPISDEKIAELKTQCISRVENEYDTCKTTFTNKCKNDTKFCSTDRADDAWQETSCEVFDRGDADLSEYEQYYCEKDYLNGKCKSSNAKCGTCTAEEIANNTCDEKLNTKNCQRVCYKKVDCSYTTVEQPRAFTCHGFLFEYKKSSDFSFSEFMNNGHLVLNHTGNLHCPEFYSEYGQSVFLDKNNPTGRMFNYIVFNQDEQVNVVSYGD